MAGQASRLVLGHLETAMRSLLRRALALFGFIASPLKPVIVSPDDGVFTDLVS
jgi:hypothetical protein